MTTEDEDRPGRTAPERTPTAPALDATDETAVTPAEHVTPGLDAAPGTDSASGTEASTSDDAVSARASVDDRTTPADSEVAEPGSDDASPAHATTKDDAKTEDSTAGTSKDASSTTKSGTTSVASAADSTTTDASTTDDPSGDGFDPEAESSGSAAKASVKVRTWRTWIKEIAIVVVLALAISTVVRTFVMRAFYIPSASMEQTLQINDRILVNQLPWSEVERGDIVVFDDPGGWLSPAVTASYEPNKVLEFLGLVPADAGQQLIKRVIGVGGDHVECCDAEGRLMVNGEPIDEPYIAPGSVPSEVDFDVTVPEGHYWVMGDNRGNSLDSRFNAQSPGGSFVPESKIVGTVFAINWPLSRMTWVSPPEEVYAGVDG